MHPRIFVTEQKMNPLRSLEELMESVKAGHGLVLYDRLKAFAERNMQMDPLTPASIVPGRDKKQSELRNRDFVICIEAGQRVMIAALMSLLTGDIRYRDDALKQMASMFNPNDWPDWRDIAESHQRYEADLRTGMLSRDLSLAYDWLYPSMDDSQRKWVIAGIDRCGIQPYLASIKEDPWWADTDNNWLTCIVGGLGIAGMALGEDHPDAEYLVDYALPRMEKYMEIYGPRGEFNESASYADSSNMVLTFYMALLYYSEGKSSEILVKGNDLLTKTSKWRMYFVVPPGLTALFGDAELGHIPRAWYYSGVAALSQDPCLQWFYLNHLSNQSANRNTPLELLWFDPSLEPQSPDGVYPLGDAFPAHGGCISSRTSWNPRGTDAVVYGKAGHGDEKHGHHDAGQLCIDGYGERLIVDIGVQHYPSDFFGPNRYEYYFASVKGHNAFVIGDRETKTGIQHKAKILSSEFDDTKGGYWQIDLTDLYEGVTKMIRTVIHLHPGHVAVLDEVELEKKEDISLRWHTANGVEPAKDGSFVVTSGGVSLSAQVIELGNQSVVFTRREHRYSAPFNVDRVGRPFPETNESFVEGRLESKSCSFLTVFSVFAPGVEPEPWRESGQGKLEITTLGGSIRVRVEDDYLEMENPSLNQVWKVSTNNSPRRSLS